MVDVTERQERLRKANELVSIIASCGRRFFLHKDRVSYFEIDQVGRVWFIDAYGLKRIYIQSKRLRWIGFSEGGTLRDLVFSLRGFIMTGEQVSAFGPWPSWYSEGDPWGYGDYMQWVRTHAQRLGVAPL